jgi:hypothetical protein
LYLGVLDALEIRYLALLFLTGKPSITSMNAKITQIYKDLLGDVQGARAVSFRFGGSCAILLTPTKFFRPAVIVTFFFFLFNQANKALGITNPVESALLGLTEATAEAGAVQDDTKAGTSS